MKPRRTRVGPTAVAAELEEARRLLLAAGSLAPLDAEPPHGYLPVELKGRALYDALAGVQAGAWDHRIIRWMAQYLDTPALLTVVSLIRRAREAGPAPPP